jgi:hypothetical protein
LDLLAAQQAPFGQQDPSGQQLEQQSPSGQHDPSGQQVVTPGVVSFSFVCKLKAPLHAAPVSSITAARTPPMYSFVRINLNPLQNVWLGIKDTLLAEKRKRFFKSMKWLDVRALTQPDAAEDVKWNGGGETDIGETSLFDESRRNDRRKHARYDG